MACRVSTLLEDLCIRLEKGAVLYLHCWGGRGRAGNFSLKFLQVCPKKAFVLRTHEEMLAKIHCCHSHDMTWFMRGGMGTAESILLGVWLESKSSHLQGWILYCPTGHEPVLKILCLVGTVGACLLAKLFGISAEEALIRVQKAFDTRKDNKAFSPETEEQRRFVRDFVNTLWSNRIVNRSVKKHPRKGLTLLLSALRPRVYLGS